MSPRHLREFFIPPFRDIVQGMKRLGLPVIMHNDGRIWDVLDDLVDTGIDAYHPVERAAGMDLARVKERYRGRLCPIGNINNRLPWSPVRRTTCGARRSSVCASPRTVAVTSCPATTACTMASRCKTSWPTWASAMSTGNIRCGCPAGAQETKNNQQ